MFTNPHLLRISLIPSVVTVPLLMLLQLLLLQLQYAKAVPSTCIQSVDHFYYAFQHATPYISGQQRRRRRRRTATQTGMVRNIDLPEALILYGRDVLFMDQREDSVRPGLSELVQECHQVETKVIVLLQHDNQQQHDEDDESKIISLLLPRIDNSNSKKNSNNNNPTITVVRVPHDAVDNDNDAAATCAVVANPAALCYAVSRVRVRERPFGGSSGFGRTPVDSSWRAPVPARCVVLVSGSSTPQGPRQARAAGMRVLQIHPCVDDPLADAAVDELDFGVDDIATPGSFWLNPPHPRDDHGNRVDPEALIAAAVRARAAAVKATDDACAGEVCNGMNDDDENVDEDWDAILADLAPLK